MTISQIRSRIDALKRRFARELLILKVRRIAQTVSDHWPSSQPPDPIDVIQRFAKAGCRLSTYGRLHRYIDQIRRKGEIPQPREMLFNLLPWAADERYDNFYRWDDLPPQEPGRGCLNLPAWV